MRMRYLPVTDLTALERDPDLGALWFADGDPVDIGEAWHAIQFLLTGSAFGGSPPLRNAVLGGTPVGEPTSYEPVRFVSAAEVADVAAALPTDQELTARFTHQAMRQAEIYPESAWQRAEALTDFVLPAYRRLREVFTAAAAAGQAVLVTLDRG